MYFCELSRAEGDVADAYAHMKSISLGLEQALCRRLMPQYVIACHRNSQRPQPKLNSLRDGTRRLGLRDFLHLTAGVKGLNRSGHLIVVRESTFLQLGEEDLKLFLAVLEADDLKGPAAVRRATYGSLQHGRVVAYHLNAAVAILCENGLFAANRAQDEHP